MDMTPYSNYHYFTLQGRYSKKQLSVRFRRAGCGGWYISKSTYRRIKDKLCLPGDDYLVCYEVSDYCGQPLMVVDNDSLIVEWITY